MDIVIIGGSAAGLSSLETILRYSREHRITVISEEPREPYCRCLLTQYLGRELSEKQLTIREVNDYPPSVNFILGQKVIAVDAVKKTVSLADARTLRFDKLLLATGAEPVKTPYCDETRGVFTLRYADDAAKIEKRLKSSAAVVGGGFVGIKTAYGMVQRGIKVSLIISSGYPLSLALDEPTGKLLEGDLVRLGIDVYTSDDVAAVSGGGALTVSLRSKKEIKTDAVVVGKGIKPRIELAQKTGIPVETGIAVNKYMETSLPDIYAAGDCCDAYDVIRRSSWVNAIWPVAVEQGYSAAMNMMGITAAYTGSMGMNSLKTHSFHLISGGMLKGDGVTVYQKYSPLKNQLRKIAVRDNVPVGIAFYNSPEDAGTFINLIKKGEPLKIHPQKIVNGDVSLMDILKPL